MLPTTNKPWSAVPKPHGESEEVPAVKAPQQSESESRAPRPADPLRPIGPERLRKLREAIRNGTYPSEADVLGGLQRMFRWEE